MSALRLIFEKNLSFLFLPSQHPYLSDTCSSTQIPFTYPIHLQFQVSETRHGYGISYSITQQKLNFFLAFSRAFGFAFFIVFKILASLGALITGQIGLESAGGTITVVKTIAEVSSQGFGSFMYVVAIISANLAVMNLLPIPALDGSRMAFTAIEMIFRKPVPRKIEGIIHTIGLVLLLLLVVFLDVFHLVNG